MLCLVICSLQLNWIAKIEPLCIALELLSRRTFWCSCLFVLIDIIGV